MSLAASSLELLLLYLGETLLSSFLQLVFCFRNFFVPSLVSQMSSPGRIYIGQLSNHTRERDIEDAFGRYGRISRVDLKNGYGFVEFEDARDADDAVRDMDRRTLDGARIIVEHARGGGRRDNDRRDFAPRPSEGRCFNCGKDGHWARDCPDEGGRDRCFNCGRGGHLARECKESDRRGSGRGLEKFRSAGRNYRSRSRSRSRGGSRSKSPRRDRSGSPKRRSRSKSRDKSDAKVADKSPRNDSRKSPRRDKSPANGKSSPATANRARSGSPAASSKRSRSRSASPAKSRSRSP